MPLEVGGREGKKNNHKTWEWKLLHDQLSFSYNVLDQPHDWGIENYDVVGCSFLIYKFLKISYWRYRSCTADLNYLFYTCFGRLLRSNPCLLRGSETRSWSSWDNITVVCWNPHVLVSATVASAKCCYIGYFKEAFCMIK